MTRRRSRLRHWREWLLFGLLVLPNLTLIIVFNYWPVIQNFYLSLNTWDFVAPLPVFVGLDNYLDLFSSGDFAQVMLNSLIYAGAIVIATLLLGLALAVLLSQPLYGSSLARVVSFAPHIVTGSAIATLWVFVLDPRYGLLQGLVGPLGLEMPDWTTDQRWSLASLIVVQVWKGAGFAAIIYLAALQGLPKDVYEAARLDAAGPWARFRRITVPLLSPITLFLLIITTLHSFRAYDVTAILTQGGPGLSSTTLTWYIYQLAFTNFDVGHATAAGTILFVLLIVISAVQNQLGKSRVHYQ